MENLKNSYEQGFGYDKAGQQLNEVFNGMEKYELERVARTEIASKENLGMYMSEQELDVEYHQWKTSIDGREREEHNEMNGQIVRVGQPFQYGLLYPLDFSSGADLSLIINCRCNIMPFIMPEGYAAPPNLDYFYESDLIKIG
jgi:SPP1 gp7 family putative phage head morphogenesis protein